MADNLHPVVELLINRIRSHPEELKNGRWGPWLDRLMALMTKEEEAAFDTLKKDLLHEEVMDELLNGDERRAKAQREYEERMKASQAHIHTQTAQLAQSINNPYTKNSLAAAQQALMERYEAEQARAALQGVGLQGYHNSISAAVENDVSLSNSTINTIKKALGSK
jgi:transketolase